VGIEVETKANVFAKHIPAKAFIDWDHLPENDEWIEVDVVLDYVPYVEEEGGAWDETIASGGNLESVWLAEGGLLDEAWCLLSLLTAKEIKRLEEVAAHEISQGRDF